jgi:hypothetical protein
MAIKDTQICRIIKLIGQSAHNVMGLVKKLKKSPKEHNVSTKKNYLHTKMIEKYDTCPRSQNDIIVYVSIVQDLDSYLLALFHLSIQIIIPTLLLLVAESAE